MGFNTQPPEGGCQFEFHIKVLFKVSTHSRLKAAGFEFGFCGKSVAVSTHSRLKAAGVPDGEIYPVQYVSTHSRLKAAVKVG